MDWIRSRALNAVTWALKEGYVFDYVLLIVLMVLNFGVAVEVVEPKERFFIPGDPTLSYPKQDDKMVPSWLLVLVAGAGPLGIFAMWQLRMRSWVDWHHSSLSAAEAFALASTWKRWMNLVGRLRPDWYGLITLVTEKASAVWLLFGPELLSNSSPGPRASHAAVRALHLY
ncbi:unnamed protein product [Ostreobium quekettii]|uniref:Uncharacterized protein n=1 Tax=Ostreobium quekettii TaxID=121088 RepID=A0A8S1IYA7_9CHLO|nr:unnamed protein product [Ostreobium quekettii]